MKRKRKQKPQILMWIILAALTFAFVYPFWHTVVVSFSDKVFANMPGFKFWPATFSLEAYKKVFSGDSIFIGYMNTIIRTVIGTVITLVITFMAAFAMSHKDLPGWTLINLIVVFTMFFEGGMIPSYLNIKELGLMGTRWALILPIAARAWNFIIMRNFVGRIDKGMEEAAIIDGANTFQVMTKVILPLSKSSLAVVGLWSAVMHWNAWFDVQLYAGSPDMQVLQTVVRRLIDEGDKLTISASAASAAATTPATIRAATVVVATLPILAGYPFIQKYLVKGTMVGAIKG